MLIPRAWLQISFFFFNDTATTEIYTLSLHDALPISGQCGIPADAKAVAFNFTVTEPTSGGDLQIAPTGGLLALPTLWYSAGQTRAKNTVLALGSSGEIVTRLDQSGGTAQLVIDVVGFFR